MTSQFDKQINRKNTLSLKYDFAIERGKPDDLLPLWVADMDFQTPPQVIEALVKQSQHGIFGYSEPKEAYFEALANWFYKRFEWSIEKDWLVKTPGVVYAIATAVRGLTQKGDSILISQPVYYPFSETIIVNERILINNPLIYKDGIYGLDLQDFEEKIITHKVKLFILCNPHNPVGRVWTKKELEALGDICLKHNVLVLSDEIHQDFIYPGNTHCVFTSIKPAYNAISITCTAPSKTFNLAGLHNANIFIPNPTLRNAFNLEIQRSGMSQLSVMGLVATQAAYTYGEPWLIELNHYLFSNLQFLRDFISQYLPKIHLVEPQGTYLVWLDCSALGLTDETLNELIIHQAKLWLDSGDIFGQDGSGFQRINIACPRATLEQALIQLANALKSY